jgi:carbon storage regulator
MLVLSRKPGEKVVIGGDTVITVTKVRGVQVTLSFEAPQQVRILRAELVRRWEEPVADDQSGRPTLGANGRPETE